MKDTVLAQTRFVSDEMLALLNDVWIAVPNWKWLALAAVFAFGVTLRPLLRAGLGRVKRASPWFRRDDTFVSSILTLDIEGVLSGVLLMLLWLAVVDGLQLTENLGKYLALLAKLGLAFYLIRLLYLAAEAAGRMMAAFAVKSENTFDDQLVPFAAKTLKATAIIMGVLIAMQNFGINVMALLAGLGIGGIAIALAAQDTAANFFGSITILLDQTFKPGDYIKVGDTEGTVENIGFRSTQVRTPYGSLVTLPNAFVAKEKIDNMQARPRRRVRQVLGLLYETTPARVERFCDEVRAMLENDPAVDRGDVMVAFVNFNAAQLDVLVQFHLPGVTDGQIEQSLTQRIFLRIMDIASATGVEFAYPTQTLYVKPPAPPEAPANA